MVTNVTITKKIRGESRGIHHSNRAQPNSAQMEK
nr:MAG TPA: hypothetical protein [Caudoviricetes sp.]